MVRCPHCQYESTGRFFCERCHQLLPVTFQAALPPSLALPDGNTVDCSSWGGVWPADAWTPRPAVWGDRSCRVYAINRTWWRGASAVVAERAALSLEVLAPLAVVPVGEAAVVVAGALDGARPALLDPDPPDADAFARLDSALAACRLLERALTPLHAAGLVWLGFDPARLDVSGDHVQICGLDLQSFPVGRLPSNLRHPPAYGAPEASAFRDEDIGPATDVFHACLYLYYRLAGLLPCGFAGQGLEAFDFDLPALRIYRPDLPVGIAPVLERGLMRDPRERFTSVAELYEALERAIGRARLRQGSADPVRIDSAGGSVIGAMHVEIGMPNQDAFGLSFVPPDAFFAVVADGVSLATVGTGDRASRIALDRLTGALPDLLAEGDPAREDERLRRLFLDTSAAILADALGDAPSHGIDPADVMSSTALLGLVRGNVLTLAGVGDSRAYLVADGVAELLTVDGDVRCLELAAGMPPENIRALGHEAFALFSCLGVGETTPAGTLVPCEGRSRPAIGRWVLRPGDVVVLCTDGLAEEGMFLGAADLARIVAETPGPAAALAEALIDAASRRSRPPSEQEPYGRGDDITCVVMAIAAR
jgi:serine/threonine protein phosphatase PrpC